MFIVIDGWLIEAFQSTVDMLDSFGITRKVILKLNLLKMRILLIFCMILEIFGLSFILHWVFAILAIPFLYFERESYLTYKNLSGNSSLGTLPKEIYTREKERLSVGIDFLLEITYVSFMCFVVQTAPSSMSRTAILFVIIMIGVSLCLLHFTHVIHEYLLCTASPPPKMKKMKSLSLRFA